MEFIALIVTQVMISRIFGLRRLYEELGRGTKDEGRNSQTAVVRQAHYDNTNNHEYTNEYKGAKFAPFLFLWGLVIITL